jgi:hypothetical protein
MMEGIEMERVFGGVAEKSDLRQMKLLPIFGISSTFLSILRNGGGRIIETF